jgi:ParB family chromosome partitioning protein
VPVEVIATWPDDERREVMTWALLRKHFNQAKLEELADSIREKGIVQPIVVRATDTLTGILLNGEKAARNRTVFEIVAGARRFRASQLAGLKTVPAMIRVFTNSQMLEVMAIENGQRDDVHPIEEAEGYRALMDTDSTYTVEIIAAKVGKSVSSVRDRLRLLRLVDEVRQAFFEERITAAHAGAIAALTDSDQLRALEACFERDYFAEDPRAMKLVSVRALQDWIRISTRLNVDAPETADLFPTLVEKLQAAQANGAPLVEISTQMCPAKQVPEGVLPQAKFRRVQKGERCKSPEQAVVVHGIEQGLTLRICRDKSCVVHFPPASKTTTAAGAATNSADLWRKQDEERKAAAERWTRLKPYALAAVAKKIKLSAFNDKLAKAIVDEMVHDDAKMFRELLGGAVTVKNFSRAVALAEALEHAWSHERFRDIAKKYGVDLAKLEKEIPEPKAAATPARKAS